MSETQKIYQNAIHSLNAGKFGDAEKLFKKVLMNQPGHVGALNLLTVILMSLQRYREAEEFIRTAVKINKSSDVSFYNYGVILKKLGRSQEALEQFNLALGLKSSVCETWNNRGTVFNDLKNYQRAIFDFDRAIALNKSYVDAYANKGKSLNELERYDDALAAYGKALALKPDLAEAWLGRGNVLFNLKHYEEAIAAYDKALALKPDLAEAWLGRGNVFCELKRYDDALVTYDEALALKPDLAETWLGRGNVLFKLKRYEEAVAAYDKALALKPDLAEAWLGRGNVFCELRCYDEAFAAYDKTSVFKPDLAEAWLGRGNVFCELKRYDEAFAAYDEALALKPGLAEAWLGRGNVFCQLKRYDDAFLPYDRALALKPDLVGTEGARLHIKMQICDWINFDTECAHLTSSVKNNKANTAPYAFLGISSSPEDQLQCAKLWVAEQYPHQKSIWQGERYNHDRIRVAYLSADFCQHPASILTVGMFECHDNSHFDVTAISLGPGDNSEIRQRLKASFEHFIDAEKYSDDKIANLIKELEIDIVVDLMGFTSDSRTGVFTRRPAPIQVNYLGYPGTMGARYIDYILADRFVIPQEKRECYSEKVVYLPDSFMPNDSKRKITERLPRRSEFSLPETGFVFCAFNQSFKIAPQIFDIWIRLLRQLDNSILWLSKPNETAVRNLKREVQNRGVDPDRIIFAQRVPLNEDHLARHQLANLFLDTLPYNAHTTASDALWAGLPVLTCLGETFAGRVTSSLLNAIGLPELITTTLEDYEQMAMYLARQPEKLAAIKQKLADNRLTKPLFDTTLFTKHIEAAYEAMYERYQAYLPPDHIVVRSGRGSVRTGNERSHENSVAKFSVNR